MITMTIRIADGKTLKDVATEVAALNAYVDPAGKFHTAIHANPLSEKAEGFLGRGNTAPLTTDDGTFVQVAIEGYAWLDLSFLPAQPTTFSIIAAGMPPVGVFAL